MEISEESLEIDKNVFPCNGVVNFRVNNIGVGTPVEWRQNNGELTGYDRHSGELVATVKVSGENLDGEAIVPAAVRLFLGGREKFEVSRFAKSNQ